MGEALIVVNKTKGNNYRKIGDYVVAVPMNGKITIQENIYYRVYIHLYLYIVLRRNNPLSYSRANNYDDDFS